MGCHLSGRRTCATGRYISPTTTAPPRQWRLLCRAPRCCRRRWCPLPDRDDLVGEVAGGHADENLLALLLAEQGQSDRALVRDPALGRLRLGGADDREGLLAVRALD